MSNKSSTFFSFSSHFTKFIFAEMLKKKENYHIVNTGRAEIEYTKSALRVQ